MKFKRFIFSFLLLFIFQSFFAQQIHDFVGIIRPQYSESDLEIKKELKKLYEEYLGKLSKSKGSSDKEETEKDEEDEEEPEKEKENQGYEEKINSEVFGSGFVYVSPDGTNYVITNHHVVEDYRMASIEFVNPETKEKTLYTDLEVVALSDNIDLALLVFPKGKKPFKHGLELYTPFLKDGEHVISAGFPGLGDKPAWQLAKGNISNERFYEKKLIDPDYSYILQHTAPIDPGNSGGPLLIEDKNAKTGYRVAGVNTWKYLSRALTAFTIPAVTVQKFLDEYFKKQNTEEVLKKRVEEFAQGLGKKTKVAKDFTKFIAQSNMEDLSFKQFENLFKKYANTKAEIFRLPAPYIPAYKRSMLAANLWGKYKTFESVKDKNVPKVEVKSIEKNKDNTYKVVFETSDGKNTIESTWMDEMNLWVVKTISYTKQSANYEKEKLHNIDTDKSVKKQNLIYTLPNIKVVAAYTHPVVGENPDAFTPGFLCNVELGISYFGFSIANAWQSCDWDTYLLNELGLSLKLPLLLGKVLCEPYGKINLDYCITSDEPVYGFSWIGGLRLILKDQNVGIDLFYKDTYLYPVNTKFNSFHLGTVGIGLIFYMDRSLF